MHFAHLHRSGCFGPVSLLEALCTVSAAEFALVRTIYEAEPWGTEWDHTREVCHIVAVGGGVKISGRAPKFTDFGPAPRGIHRSGLTEAQQLATQRAFIALARSLSKGKTDGT